MNNIAAQHEQIYNPLALSDKQRGRLYSELRREDQSKLISQDNRDEYDLKITGESDSDKLTFSEQKRDEKLKKSISHTPQTKKKQLNVNVKQLLDRENQGQLSKKNKMVRGLVDKNVEISIALFCLENVKYESEDRAMQFLYDHDQRHPPFATPLKDQRKCLICKTRAITSSEAESNFYTPG